jgi:hypothetical protein
MRIARLTAGGAKRAHDRGPAVGAFGCARAMIQQRGGDHLDRSRAAQFRYGAQIVSHDRLNKHH